MVKLDFSNAFNCPHYRDMLLAFKQHLRDNYSYCCYASARPTHLFHGQYLILSYEGPLGPLFFSITIQPLLGYLDDLTVGDSHTKVAADVLRIKTIGESIGFLSISVCVNWYVISTFYS